MKRLICVWVVSVLFSIGLTGLTGVRAEDLTAHKYCVLSEERLALTRDIWHDEGRGLNEAEMIWLYERFGTTPGDYLAFASSRRTEIEAYLNAHTDLRLQIERLSAEIDTIIQMADQQ